ncbi:FAD-binding oxidoreductase [Allostreptomyces psammosilenae]|uniref:Aclacinomycin oxidase n=1 Tax=Allostreptomyces psammosilenae TaxID=1892865 RepID=A0A852ZZJ9_9ACTN|nr:FAD-binding oxidoreductase [Allostreptomyces psammosilenae]NYI06650.1 aclacinomycin oxidase [Allostreptomyces psammosilenae]
MPDVARRGFLGLAAALGGTAAGLTVAPVTTEKAVAETVSGGGSCPPLPGAVTVTRDDPRYAYLSTRGLNTRFSNQPDSIHQVFSTEQVRQVVEDAVRAGRRIAVRSGGHCLESLVDNPEVRSVIDLAEMNEVYYDPARQAFAAEAGAQLGQVYRSLYLGYGVTIPGGTCPTVGLGGYVSGGGFGAMCRQHGLIVDHLYAVEVVVVDSAGRARTVVATREPSDPNRELWWAHTGAGGGNFGVVTRYWFRAPGAQGDDPTTLLPKPPRTILRTTVSWPWSGMNEASFARLVRNHGEWHARNSGDGSPYASLFSGLYLNQRIVGAVTLDALIDGSLPNAQALMDDYVAALNAGVTAPSTVTNRTAPWLASTLAGLADPGMYSRAKGKGAYLRKPYTDAEIATVWKHVSDPAYNGRALVLLYSYGGKVNTVAPSATAVPQRDSIIKSYIGTYWADPNEDAKHVDWIRGFYQELYAGTGGVPLSNDSTDGSYINYPDVDLLDSQWNRSGVPWHTLYFKDNYPRLQQVKARWDPRNVFRHALSVQAPG